MYLHTINSVKVIKQLLINPHRSSVWEKNNPPIINISVSLFKFATDNFHFSVPFGQSVPNGENPCSVLNDIYKRYIQVSQIQQTATHKLRKGETYVDNDLNN